MKIRGFKPQGQVAPIKTIQHSGPTIKDVLERDTRPSWDNFMNALAKKQESSIESVKEEDEELYKRQLDVCQFFYYYQYRKFDLKNLTVFFALHEQLISLIDLIKSVEGLTRRLLILIVHMKMTLQEVMRETMILLKRGILTITETGKKIRVMPTVEVAKKIQTENMIAVKIDTIMMGNVKNIMNIEEQENVHVTAMRNNQSSKLFCVAFKFNCTRKLIYYV